MKLIAHLREYFFEYRFKLGTGGLLSNLLWINVFAIIISMFVTGIVFAPIFVFLEVEGKYLLFAFAFSYPAVLGFRQFFKFREWKRRKR